MSETKQFDVPEVLAALEAAVARRGEDYEYERPLSPQGAPSGCLYVHDRYTENPTPGCIVGQVYFDLLGRLVPAPLELRICADDINYTPNSEWRAEGTFTDGAIRVLGRAQVAQDDGASWGEALAAARKAAEGR
jgi:hypothetical protein